MNHYSEVFGPDKYRPKYPDSPFIHIADLVDKESGKTYRKLNEEKVHKFSIGSLLEYIGHCDNDDDEYDENLNKGFRLFVMLQTRDCDGTPLYWLGPDLQDMKQQEFGFANQGWSGGYMETGLRLISEPPNSLDEIEQIG